MSERKKDFDFILLKNIFQWITQIYCASVYARVSVPSAVKLRTVFLILKCINVMRARRNSNSRQILTQLILSEEVI